MDPRQRYIETLTFGTPDRAPLWPGWGRRPTLAARHEQGLPKEKGFDDYHDYLWEILDIDFDRCIAKGGQALIDELKRVEPVMEDGGYIPCCDHAVPPDVSWPDFVEYTRLLAKMTGWL